MVDRLQNIAIAIGDVCILPVERYAVIGAIHVPETQRSASRHWAKLLIEGAISKWLVVILLAMGVLLRVAACECRLSPGVHLRGVDYRIVDMAVNDPRREASAFKSAVLDKPGIARRRWTSCRSRCRRRRGLLSAWKYPNIINIFFVLATAWIEVERGRIRHIAPRVI